MRCASDARVSVPSIRQNKTKHVGAIRIRLHLCHTQSASQWPSTRASIKETTVTETMLSLAARNQITKPRPSQQNSIYESMNVAIAEAPGPTVWPCWARDPGKDFKR